MNLQTMLRGAFPVLLAVGAAFWFQGVSEQQQQLLLPSAALNWGPIVEQTSPEGGEARLKLKT